MKKDVLINILSSQTIDGQTDNMEVSVTGTLLYGDNDYKIEYTEYDGDMQGCSTHISVEGENCVSILREGEFGSEMMLENGKRHSCLYTTPYGQLTIGLYTKKINSYMSAVGGTLEMAYTIDFTAGQSADNNMKITVSEREV